MGKNMITIDTKLARAFNKAVTNVENIDEIQEDGINWNFVGQTWRRTGRAAWSCPVPEW